MVEERTELIDYLGVIWKWKLLIVLIAVVCAVTSGVISFVLPKIYQSSAVFEVGRVSRYRGADREQIEPIEDIESVTEVLQSDEMLSMVKERLNMDATLGGMRAKLDVEPILGKYIGSRLQARLIKISFEDQDPGLTVAVLNTLSDLLIEQHIKEYQASIESLSEQINNSEKKTEIISKEIDLQSSYQTVVRDQIEVVEKAIAETKTELSELSLKDISPLEVLFLRSTLGDQAERIADFHRELIDTELSIKEGEKDVQNLRDRVVYLENMRAVSENTEVRNKAIKPEIPIRPRKKLNAIIGGVVGLMAAIILAFFFESLQTVRKREEAK